MEPDRDKRRRLLAEAKGRGDVSYLVEAARRDVELRDVAARLLGDVGDTAAVGPLVELLKDWNPQVRAAAVRSLGRLRAQEASPVLFTLAREDPVFFVRDWSIQALAEIGEPDVVPLALEALDDEDVRIRRSAAIALGRVGGADVLDDLRRAKRRDHLLRRALYRDASSQIRRAARREKQPSESPATISGATRVDPRHRRAASVAVVILVSLLMWAALAWIGAPLWIRIAGAAFAVLVWLRYMFIRMRYRTRRSRLPLRSTMELHDRAQTRSEDPSPQ